MRFICARAKSCKRRGFDITLVEVVLHSFKFFQRASGRLVNFYVTWRDGEILNNFKLAHIHIALLARKIYIFARLEAYAFCTTCQLQPGLNTCQKSKENDRQPARCCLCNSSLLRKLIVLQRGIWVWENDAIFLPFFSSFDLYVDKILNGQLRCVDCKQSEIDVWNVLGYYVCRTYVQIEFRNLRFLFFTITLDVEYVFARAKLPS